MPEYFPHRSQVIMTLSLGFICGVGIGIGSGSGNIFTPIVFFCALAVPVLSIIGYKYRQIWIIITFLIGVVVGAVSTEHRLALHDDYIRHGEKVSGSGVVVREPSQSARSLNVFIAFNTRELTVLARMPKYEQINLGDVVSIACTLEKPKPFNDFNYPKYLQMQGVEYLCDDPILKREAQGENFLAKIANFRKMMESGINQKIKHPEAGLANGLLFGGDDRLSDNLQESFARTGMSHIVAVSGYNVTVITFVVIAVGIFLGLWRHQAAWVACACIVLFVIMIGFPSSGIRAAVMGTLVLAAMIWGRTSHALGALILAGALMLAWNPLQLFYDIGFQLSFGAVLGIMFFFPLCERYVIKSRRSFGLLDVLFLTISAQLFVIPIILYHFGVFSTTSLLSNLLVLPILPYTMFLVFIAAILGVFSTPINLLAIPFALLAQWLLTYEIWVIEYFASKSWSVVTIENFPLWLGILYYGILSAVIIFFYRKNAYEKY